MPTFLAIGLLMAAGAALVVQNLLMLRLTALSSTTIIPLAINSAVGLALLLILLLLRSGANGLAEAASVFRPWVLLPGILGTFFVFAGLNGYQHIGAAPTIAVLVASQLAAGIVADMIKAGHDPFPSGRSLVGAALLISGAFLIARERV